MTRVHLWDIFACKEKMALAGIFIVTDSIKEKWSSFLLLSFSLLLYISRWIKLRNKIIFKTRPATKCSNGPIGPLTFPLPFPSPLDSDWGNQYHLMCPGQFFSLPGLSSWPLEWLILGPGCLGHQLQWFSSTLNTLLQRTLPSTSAFKERQG